MPLREVATRESGVPMPQILTGMRFSERRLLHESSADSESLNAASNSRCRANPMKKLEAVIPQYRILDVERALLRWGIEGMSISSVFEVGHEPAIAGRCSARGIDVPQIPRLKLELLVSDDSANAVIEILCGSAGIDPHSDVAVIQLEKAYHIRTGESETPAIA